MNARTHAGGLSARVDAYDWPALDAALDARGYAILEGLLPREDCLTLAEMYDEPVHFRSRVHMAGHGFGRGEYRYFGYPLPHVVATLRTALYARLYAMANVWNGRLGVERRYPPLHEAFLRDCREVGQARPTPLLLRYGADDFNCLHQDVYGDLVFPLQAVVLLSEPGSDFGGGELVLSEQRPRQQSRAEVVPLRQGDAAVFAVRYRPARGARGDHRVNMRHGVSRVRNGRRHALGIIFHDAS
ncbi:2OG-Fe(II) oxygenase [Acidihalobacter prosperus]|uniref:Proline hydroxylase n=1 Tax=Acidihalobacter prosperus TaxID=160660 RepID=A0A1A6C1C6_9GAMM|nr:2OG-Fe(II) oxygenase [Acidihalobacter prosperus]OBS08350.1 proline hydroxylase [Acidihalobacter prosperus]